MESDTYLYIIGKLVDYVFVSPCKVGITASLRSRLSQIQTAAPFRVAIHTHFTLPNREIAVALERAFHVVQNDKKLHGEWFDMSPDRAFVIMLVNLNCHLVEACGLSQEETRQIMSLSVNGHEGKCH